MMMSSSWKGAERDEQMEVDPVVALQWRGYVCVLLLLLMVGLWSCNCKPDWFKKDIWESVIIFVLETRQDISRDGYRITDKNGEYRPRLQFIWSR